MVFADAYSLWSETSSQLLAALIKVPLEAAHRASEEVLRDPTEERPVGDPIQPAGPHLVVCEEGQAYGVRALLLEQPTTASSCPLGVAPLEPAGRFDDRDEADHPVRQTGGAQDELQPGAGAHRGLSTGRVQRPHLSEAEGPLGEAPHVEEGGEDLLGPGAADEVARAEGTA